VNLTEAAEFHRGALLRLNRSPMTLRLYAIYENSFLAFLVESQTTDSLDALNPQFVREWQAYLRARSTGRRGGVVTEKQGVMMLKTWARFLWENDIYDFDPLARLKIPRVNKIHRKPFSEDDARKLVGAAAQGVQPIRDRALLLIMFDTGCRVGELCQATLDDLDLVEGSILFRRTKNGHPRKVIFRVPSRRDGGPALSSLRNWLKVREARDGVTALFTTRERLPLSTRRVREIFSELGRAARVPNSHPHRTRHSNASEFLAQRPGAEIQLRSRLGQLSREVLSDYVSLSDQTKSEIAEVASLSARWGL
jgi:site-specific recombinase XerC